MDLKEEALLGDRVHTHWYYRAKLAALLQATADLRPGAVMDVGAGTGFFSRALLQAGRATAALCVDPGYPADTDEAVAGRPLRFRRALDPGEQPVAFVMMMDVLEHVADDAALVREYAARVPSGTRFIVTVPAFDWLWSGHDVYLEHHRRYTLPRLETALRQAGLQVEFGCYYYGAVLPVAAGFRMAKRLLGGRGHPAQSDMRLFGPIVNGLFYGACRAELPWFRMNRLAGLTVFARAAKP